MGVWVCQCCGSPSFGWVFWRIRGPTGTHIADRSSLAAARRLLRQYGEGWAKGAKIYRVTWSKKTARCYWPPDGAVKRGTTQAKEKP